MFALNDRGVSNTNMITLHLTFGVFIWIIGLAINIQDISHETWLGCLLWFSIDSILPCVFFIDSDGISRVSYCVCNVWFVLPNVCIRGVNYESTLTQFGIVEIQ